MGADLIILEIDSPGGLVEESFRIAEKLTELRWAKTVAFVPRGAEAISGAAIVALGCDEIIMAADSQLGDAGPIKMGGDAFEHAEEKLLSYLVGKIRPLAEANGRPPALAEAMMDRHCEVFEVTNKQTGKRTFMSKQELQAARDAGEWEVGPLVFESRDGVFLTVSGRRAVELQLAEGNAQTREDLKARYGLAVEPTVLEHTWVDTTAYVLTRPLVTALLLIIALVCMYIEFSAPGTAVGGLIATLCFAAFFWSRFLGGTSGWLEVMLFVTGLAFVAVEIFLLPGFGISGMLGGILVVVSIVLASQRVVIPRTSYDLNSLLTFLSVMVGSGVGFVGLALVLRRYFGLIPTLSGIVLQPPAPEPAAAAEPQTDWRAGLLGAEGVSVTALRPAGKARFGERTLDVVAEGSYILQGNPVRVVSIQGSRVIVEQVT
jgi:membrane-bound serine protease (ClpP class)